MSSTRPKPFRSRALEAEAAQVKSELAAQEDAWGERGWSRRRFIGGVGMVGVAALGTQLVTAKGSFAATPQTASTDGVPSTNTLLVIFLRGAADGLQILLPNSSDLGVDYLKSVRSSLVTGMGSTIALPDQNGWAVHASMAPLYNQLWSKGQMAFVPACSTDGFSQSHFQAQQFMERGGSDTASSGWLNNLLSQLGAGTTFRALSEGGSLPLSLLGSEKVLSMGTLSQFTLPGWDSINAQTQAALTTLYRNAPAPLNTDVPETFAALSTAASARSAYKPAATYPSGGFASQLSDMAALIKADVGLQVATLDVGGWDTHTDEAGDFSSLLLATSNALTAFFQDLGPAASKVTVAVMTEFGRRVPMNASGGTDHGHGSLMWLLGGGLKASGVYGKWNKLTADDLYLEQYLPGWNNPFDVLAEAGAKRLGATNGSAMLPGYDSSSLGLFTTT